MADLVRWGVDNIVAHPYRFREDGDKWADMIRRHSLFLREQAGLGVKTYTIHLGWHTDRSAVWNFAQLRKTVDALLPVCETTSITLTLENSAEPAASHGNRVRQLERACLAGILPRTGQMTAGKISGSKPAMPCG